MSRHIDDILDLIDGGLQTSTELDYGRVGQAGTCVRCSDATDEEHDLCGPCRAWLLGDTDVDPRLGEQQQQLNGLSYVIDGRHDTYCGILSTRAPNDPIIARFCGGPYHGETLAIQQPEPVLRRLRIPDIPWPVRYAADPSDPDLLTVQTVEYRLADVRRIPSQNAYMAYYVCEGER